MKQFTLYYIKNIAQLEKTLDACRGKVQVVMRNGKAYDWRENRELLVAVLQSVPMEKGGRITLALEDDKDIRNLAKKMITANVC